MKKQSARLESVKTGENKNLLVTYTDKNTVSVNLSKLIADFDCFAPDNTDEFETVEITDFGFTLEWACGASLDCDRILEMALEQSGLIENANFRRWQDNHHLSLAQAAQALGLTRRTISQYRTGKRPVSRTVLLACKGWELENLQ